MNAALTSSGSSDRLAFANGKLHRSDGYFTCEARIAVGGEEWPLIELEMIEPYRADMLAYFEELAASAKHGLEDVNSWESEFSQLHIAARRAGDGVVRLDVFARWKPHYDATRRGAFNVSAEEVERFAERMSKFLRMEKGYRFHGDGRRSLGFLLPGPDRRL